MEAPVGYPARDEPHLLGWVLVDVDIREELIGKLLVVRNRRFIINVSYTPAMPKKERLIYLLQPLEELPEEFWGEGTRRAKPKLAPKQEVFPF